QVYFKVDAVGAERYELVKLLDLGDLIGVEGPLFRTKTGEVTVRVERFTLLTKSLRPLPLGKEDAQGKRHGELSDPELRARQRYADLAVHPEVRGVPAAGPRGRLHPEVPRRAGLPRGGDAGAAAGVRRRLGAAVRHALRGARHGCLSADRRRAVSQALHRGRAGKGE